jgi:hypothetical protein
MTPALASLACHVIDNLLVQAKMALRCVGREAHPQPSWATKLQGILCRAKCAARLLPVTDP